ncbi:MAG: PA2779 family protein [Gammaproteobacteria bacterium]|nr:PA2779 family protein [Gammaproteobacteria bacterium]
MIARSFRSPLLAILALAIVNMGTPGIAHAGILGTEILVESGRSANLDAVRMQLQREDVRAELARMGVDEAMLDARLAKLGDSELAQLAEQMKDAPAGGILALLGAVFVVLLVLEWVGVVDVFKNTPHRR